MEVDPLGDGGGVGNMGGLTESRDLGDSGAPRRDDRQEPPTRVAAPAHAVWPVTAEADAPYCFQCGVQMIRSGTCHACPSCGTTSGCS